MKVIVGLGNPGKEYENTRHNIGFSFLDWLQKDLSFPDFQPDKYSKSLKSLKKINNQEVLLLKPQTFMNLSGESLIRLKKELDPQDFLIIFDDFDLPCSHFRIKSQGSAGSHNGMKSILQHLGGDKVPRLRIGIRPDHPVGNATNFVLSRFSKEEELLIESRFCDIKEACILFLQGDMESAARKFNRKIG